ncbi:MAG: hypothetical protein M1832_003397 [Thelocarpon impressellum]|nr:MAG: hypothetical protein M1832_003397 [Thelocarpon impressellum]
MDFYLINHLMKGLDSSAWFTCLAPETLVEKYTEYAHGNHFNTRYVVLDETQRPENVQVFDETVLLEEFLAYLEDTCKAADAANEPVFVAVFGHGESDDLGIEIGRAADGSEPLLLKSAVQAILDKFPSLSLSIMFTSCYSGGWTTHLKISALTAASHDKFSESWPAPVSVGRVTGSIFTSAVIDMLQQDDIAAGVKEEAVTYQQFAESIKATVLLLDKVGDRHGVSFSAQDDEWEQEHHRRTGIPAAHYRDKLLELRILPSTDKTESAHGDRTSDEQSEMWGQQRIGGAPPARFGPSVRRRPGGSTRGVQRCVAKKAWDYLNAKPGRDTLACHHHVHRLARKCLSSPCTMEELEDLDSCLDYRVKAMETAQAVVRVMGIGSFQQPRFFDYEEWTDSHGGVLKEYYHLAYRAVLDGRFLPKPLRGEGRAINKQTQYVAAALVEQRLTVVELASKISLAVSCKHSLTSFQATWHASSGTQGPAVKLRR